MSEKYKVILVDYDDDLFTPRGNEAELLAGANAHWHVGQYRQEKDVLFVTKDADIVMIQSLRLLLTDNVIRNMDRCRCIIRLGIGYDSVDVKTATESGILVCNIPLYCIDDVAEHALALLFDAIRHAALQDRWIRQGKWDRRGAQPARRIRGSTLGLLSFGRIARGVTERAKGLGVIILAYDPYVSTQEMAHLGVAKVDLEELLRRSDFISVHTPLTESTHHLLGRSEFEMVKPGVVLVNTSRGQIIDSQALVDALKSGKVGAVGLDVMEQEPLPKNSPLRQFETVSFTPHVGACTDQSVADLYRTACEIACDVLSGGWPTGVVNPKVKPRFEMNSQVPK